MEPFADVYEVLILDGYGREGEGSGLTCGTHVARSWEMFEEGIADTLLAASGIKSVAGAIAAGEATSYRMGDLLFDFKGVGGEQMSFSKDRDDNMRDDDLAFKLSRSLFSSGR